MRISSAFSGQTSARITPSRSQISARSLPSASVMLLPPRHTPPSSFRPQQHDVAIIIEFLDASSFTSVAGHIAGLKPASNSDFRFCLLTAPLSLFIFPARMKADNARAITISEALLIDEAINGRGLFTFPVCSYTFGSYSRK